MYQVLETDNNGRTFYRYKTEDRVINQEEVIAGFYLDREQNNYVVMTKDPTKFWNCGKDFKLYNFLFRENDDEFVLLPINSNAIKAEALAMYKEKRELAHVARVR